MKNHRANIVTTGVLGLVACNATGVHAAEAPTFMVKMLAPETALKAAQIALAQCRKNGFQTAVAVVDRAGVVQVILRDRYAGPHTPDMAVAKAWTAASFKRSTSSLAVETQPGKPMQNGLVERLNGTIRTECLNLRVFQTICQVQEALDVWWHRYNFERPHSALKYQTPGSIYEKGERFQHQLVTR